MWNFIVFVLVTLTIVVLEGFDNDDHNKPKMG